MRYPIRTYGRPSHWRNGKLVRSFTPAEDAEIERLRIAGLGLGRIARAVDRGRSSIQMRLETLARFAEQSEGDE